MPRRSKNQVTCTNFKWNLFKRDRIYYADGRINDPPLGKHSLGVSDYRLALEKLQELDQQMAAAPSLGVPGTIPKSNLVLLIPDWWDAYLAHVARAEVLNGAGATTQKRYRAVSDKHKAYCRERKVLGWANVDKKHVLAYGSHLHNQGYADATIYLECTLLKQVVKWLIEEEGKLPRSHEIKLSLRRSQETTTYCYSRKEVVAIIELCRKKPRLNWLADAIVGLVHTGMRVGELAALRWRDVDLEGGFITVSDNRHSDLHAKANAIQRTKNRRSRRIPMNLQLLSLLNNLQRREDGRVFGGPSGRPLEPNSACKIFIREVITPLKQVFPTAAGEIGFANGRIHSFRHFFISQAFVQNAGEGQIREWVGHRDSRIVERYRHLSSEDAKRKMTQINFVGVGLETVQSGQSNSGTENDGSHQTDHSSATPHPDVPDAA